MFKHPVAHIVDQHFMPYPRGLMPLLSYTLARDEIRMTYSSVIVRHSKRASDVSRCRVADHVEEPSPRSLDASYAHYRSYLTYFQTHPRLFLGQSHCAPARRISRLTVFRYKSSFYRNSATQPAVSIRVIEMSPRDITRGTGPR